MFIVDNFPDTLSVTHSISCSKKGCVTVRALSIIHNTTFTTFCQLDPKRDITCQCNIVHVSEGKTDLYIWQIYACSILILFSIPCELKAVCCCAVKLLWAEVVYTDEGDGETGGFSSIMYSSQKPEEPVYPQDGYTSSYSCIFCTFQPIT